MFERFRRKSPEESKQNESPTLEQLRNSLRQYMRDVPENASANDMLRFYNERATDSDSAAALDKDELAALRALADKENQERTAAGQ